jgi:hypothetical protein
MNRHDKSSHYNRSQGMPALAGLPPGLDVSRHGEL